MNQSIQRSTSGTTRRVFLKSAAAGTSFLAIPSQRTTGTESSTKLAINGLDSARFYQRLLAEHIPLTTPDKAEAILVAVPLKERGATARRLLTKGRHVLIEPPVALDYTEFDALMLEANNRNLRIGVACYHRFLEGAIHIRDLVHHRDIGKVVHVHITIGNRTDDPLLTRCLEGYLGTALPLLDLARWITEQSPEFTSVQKNLFADYLASPPALSLQVDMRGIPVVCQTGGAVSPECRNGWLLELHGSDGLLRLDGSGTVSRSEGASWRILHHGRAVEFSAAVRRLIQDFLESCQTGREPEVNALDGMSGIALTRSAVQSAATGATSSMIIQPRTQDSDRIWAREQRSRKQQ